MRVPEQFRRFDLRRPSAGKWNGFLRWVLSQRAVFGEFGGGRAEPFGHPWQVDVERWTDAPRGSNVDAERTWKVKVAAGTVNDELATVLYRRKGDERGWEMPTDYPAPKAGEFGYHPVYVDRLLIEPGGEGPFLTVEAPKRGERPVAAGANPRGFVAVPDAQRLPFFRTEEMLERELFVAFVIVSADPGTVERYLPQVRVPLRRFRVFVGQRPTNAAARVGGYRELARLYLTRERSGNPAEDRLYVQQRTFWCLGTLVVQPDVPPLPDTGGLDPLADLLVEVANGTIGNVLEGAAFQEWWTC